MSQQTIEVVITATDTMDIKGPEENIGWGKNGCDLCVVGPVANIRVSQGGEDGFSLRIFGNGTLTLTSHQGVYETDVPRNLTLCPSRPWAAEGK